MRIQGVSECPGVIVSLCGREHLCAAFGEAFAVRALDALRSRIAQWGGRVRPLDDAHLLVQGAWQDASCAAPFSSMIPLLEDWQVALSSVVVENDTAKALPVVVLDALRPLPQAEAGMSELSDAHVWDCLHAARPWLAPVQRTPAWRNEFEQGMRLASAVQEAQREGRMTLACQSIVHCDDSRRVLYDEALLRIDGLDVTNDRLFPLLESLGLVRSIDRYVALKALDLLEADPNVRLGINVSAQSLCLDPWWYSIMDRMAAVPESAARLTFELTETAPVHDVEGVGDFTDLLHSLGCSIALDDFGAGHSSLALVRRIKPEFIKIDRGVIVDACTDQVSARALEALVFWSRTQGAEVIAEGIEEVAELQAAFCAGINWMQGYFFHRPQPRTSPASVEVAWGGHSIH